MLEPVGCAREHGAPFVPDDLLVVRKPDPEQAIEDLPCKLRGVPHVAHLQTGHQRKGLRPVGAGITGYGRFPVSWSALLHIARFGSATVESGAVAPFRIKLDPIGRVGHHQPRRPLSE